MQILPNGRLSPKNKKCYGPREMCVFQFWEDPALCGQLDVLLRTWGTQEKSYREMYSGTSIKWGLGLPWWRSG